MNTLRRISVLMIAVPLVATLWSARWMIPFVQPERADVAARTARYMFSYENFVHEAGFARATIALIGLVILFVPYRKGERWALVALSIVIFAYEIPVFVFGAIPNLGTWPIFRNWPPPQTSSPATARLLGDGLTVLSIAGLALAVPAFLKRDAKEA